MATPLAAAKIAYPESFFSIAEVNGVALRDLLSDFKDESVDVCRGIADLREMVPPLRKQHISRANDRREPGEGLILRRPRL